MSKTFTSEEFFEWLGQWHRLADWQLRTMLAVAAVKADEAKAEPQQAVSEHLETIAKQSKPAARSSQRRPYSDDELLEIMDAAEKWDSKTKSQRRLLIRSVASKHGRTYKAIDRQIYRARFSK